jgi:hypothetical protein
MAELNATISNLLNLAALIGVGLAALYFGFGGITYMTSGGSPMRAESGKKACFDALVGLGLVLSARVITSIIQGAIVR